MQSFVTMFSGDRTVLAVANLFAIVSGLAFVFVTGRAVWRFIKNAYHSSIKAAYGTMRLRNRHQIAISASDPSYFLSILAGYGSLLVVALTGMVLTGLSRLRVPQDPSHLRYIGMIYLLLLLVVFVRILLFTRSVQTVCAWRFYQEVSEVGPKASPEDTPPVAPET